MKLDYIKQFYFSLETAWYLISAVAVFIASVFIQHRIKAYLTLLAITWIVLTITDVALIHALDNIAMNNILLNILYNLLGRFYCHCLCVYQIPSFSTLIR